MSYFRTMMVQTQLSNFQAKSGLERTLQGGRITKCHFETTAIFKVWMLIKNYSYVFTQAHITNSTSYRKLGDALVFNFMMVLPIMNLFHFRLSFYSETCYYSFFKNSNKINLRLF